MITIKEKLRLMSMYARPYFTVSGLGTLSAVASLALVGKGSVTGTFISLTALKGVVMAISLILFKLLESKEQAYFYINIGLHTSLLLRWAVIIDIISYLILCTSLIIIRNVIF